MTNRTPGDDAAPPASFYEVLRKALKKRKTVIENICPPSDLVARRILEEYGAIFVADKKVKIPPVCIFTSETQVEKFQDEADYITETIAGADIELQPEAMKALIKAREEAQKEGLDITPRDGRRGGPAWLSGQPGIVEHTISAGPGLLAFSGKTQ